MVFSLNRACGAETLTDERLEKAFSVWYHTLEEQLNSLLQNKPVAPEETEDEDAIDSASEILEEILDLTRNNQKLLRNPEGEYIKEIESIKTSLEKIGNRLDQEKDHRRSKRDKRMHPMFIEELLHISPRFEGTLTGFQIAISIFRNDSPWLYDAGLDLTRTLRSNSSSGIEKHDSVNAFYELIEFTFDHPMMREFYMPDKDMWVIGRELPRLLKRSLDRYLSS